MTQPIRRVVVSVDAASETRIAIDTAARLAVRWGVPLHGVFIEDEELIGLAGLPFARQVTLGIGPSDAWGGAGRAIRLSALSFGRAPSRADVIP